MTRTRPKQRPDRSRAAKRDNGDSVLNSLCLQPGRIKYTVPGTLELHFNSIKKKVSSGPIYSLCFRDEDFRLDKITLYDIRVYPCAGILVGAGSSEFSLVIRYCTPGYGAGALDGKPFSDQHDGGWRIAAGACLESGFFPAPDYRL